ncbi:hypothetical protein [Massilia sp. 9I]|nr:hypothetical protein [Massilia sp. 9I]VXC20467.1 hypothetical protein MASSI9I_51413 [Massilia sp. 9I]
MESIIWALDLAAVAYLCLWALRTDKAESAENQGKSGKPGQNGQGPDNA